MKAIITCSILLSPILFGQGYRFPSIEKMEEAARARGTLSNDREPYPLPYGEDDFDPPPPGQVLMAEWRQVKHARDRIAALLAAAPDDETGKQSPWYGQWQAWIPLIDQFLASKLPADLFPAIPLMVEFRSENRPELCPELQGIIGITYELSFNVVHAMAKHIAEFGGTVSAENLERFVLFFSVQHMGDPWPEYDTQWPEEYKWKPLDEAGVLILDATAVVAQLKAGPWRRAERFIGKTDREVDNFFSFYNEEDEWGLLVLEAKYAANKAAIDAKFEELKTWVVQQKAQEENPEEE